jgi:arginine decarboxylase
LGQILRRGVPAPLLLRYDGVLRTRVRQINDAFNEARNSFGYQAAYRGVYPIKVNQERHVVETLLEEGRQYGMGLEVGSKPELRAGIALQAGEGSLMICNGYKDEEYVEMALLSSQLGITAIIVIEKFTELGTIGGHIGIRSSARSSSRSAARAWQNGGPFVGLHTRIVAAVEDRATRCRRLQSCTSTAGQITRIGSVKRRARRPTC